MNDDESFALRATNVSRPRLGHVGSRQSISATEEYQSAQEQDSRSVSPISDDEPHGNIQRYSTPPQGTAPEFRSPDTRLPATRALTEHAQSDTYQDTSASAAPFQNRTLRRKPVGSTSPSPPRISQIEPAGSPPTPGVDDTPYIRFALDQLTRDEEVRGSRKYGPAVGSAVYPDDRGLAEAASVPTTSAENKSVLQQPMTADIRPPPPIAPVIQPYQHFRRHNSSDQNPVTPQEPDVFIPYDPPVDSLAYPALDFIPGILRPLQLGTFLFLCFLMLVGLLFCAIYPLLHDNGLYNYTQFGGSRYFIFQYLPTLLGMCILLWLLQIQIALQRITPFLCMASTSVISRSHGPHLELHPTSFLLPKLFYFRAAMPVIGAAMLIFWLFLWTVPLLAALFGVVWYGSPATGTWRWVTVQGVVWTVIVLYVFLVWILVVLMLWLPRQLTGLKWDPRSLADFISLISQSNISKDYDGSDIFFSSKDFQNRLSKRSDRLGYWYTSRYPTHVFYGIGEEGAAIRRYSLEGGKIREKPPVERSSFPDTPTTHGGKNGMRFDFESGDIDEIQHRYLPWYLRPSLLLLWIVTLFILYLAFLIVSYVNDAVIRGFAPLTPVRPDASGFGAANFLYSFLPALIAHVLFLAWLSIDYSFRHLQPFADLNNATTTHYDASRTETPFGADAAHSLLLDYPARLPLSVTLAAFSASHLRVAWFSVLTLTSATLPVLAGGVFWAQWYVRSQEVRVAVDPSGYYALCVFLALIVVSLPLALPGLRSRRGLPHASKTLAENLSWLYASGRSLGAGWADVGGGRAEMVTRLLEREGVFAFGVLTNPLTRKRCLGIHRLADGDDEERWGNQQQTPERGPVLIRPVPPAHLRAETADGSPASQQGLIQNKGQPLTPSPPQARQMAQMTPQQTTYTTTGEYLSPTTRNEKTTSSEYGDDFENPDQKAKEMV